MKLIDLPKEDLVAIIEQVENEYGAAVVGLCPLEQLWLFEDQVYHAASGEVRCVCCTQPLQKVVQG
jgi:hypothetical protein